MEHEKHQTSDQEATAPWLWRVEHAPWFISLSLFDAQTTVNPMTVAGPCQCAAHSRFALLLPLQWSTTSPTWKRSLVTRLDHISTKWLISEQRTSSRCALENPLLWRVPTVINGRIAGPCDSGGEPCHAVHWFSNKLDAELVDQPSCVCFPDCSLPFMDCVLLWGVGMIYNPCLRALVQFSLLLGRKATFAARHRE